MSTAVMAYPLFHPADTDDSSRRLKQIFTREIGFVARLLRNLGVPERDIDDATQQVFIVLSRKLDAIRPGTERGFLFRTASHVAAHFRRSLGRKRETFGELPDVPLDHPGADELLDEQRARELLDRVLAKMDGNARIVFVLYEIEHLTLARIAAELDLPPGTVSSRLRRARLVFRSQIERLTRAIRRA